MLSISNTGMIFLTSQCVIHYVIVQLLVVFWKYLVNSGVLLLADAFDIPLEEAHRVFSPQQPQTIG